MFGAWMDGWMGLEGRYVGMCVGGQGRSGRVLMEGKMKESVRGG